MLKIKSIKSIEEKTPQEVYCLSVNGGEVIAVGKSGTGIRIGQTINFGLNYGRTAYGMSRGLGISPEEAQAFIDKYFEEFPMVREFMEKANNTVKKYKFVKTIIKRRRRFDNYNKLPVPKGVDVKTLDRKDKMDLNRQRELNNKAIERKATNAIIQGSAADIMKIAMRNMFPKLDSLDAHILLQIHDEVIVEVPEANAKKALELVKYEMENAVTLVGIPLVADSKIADVWEK